MSSRCYWLHGKCFQCEKRKDRFCKLHNKILSDPGNDKLHRECWHYVSGVFLRADPVQC